MTLPSLDTQYLVTFLTDLLNTPSPTGYTDLAIEHIRQALAAYPELSLSLNRKGTLIALWPGERSDAPRALTMHADTLGAMVKEISPAAASS